MFAWRCVMILHPYQAARVEAGTVFASSVAAHRREHEQHQLHLQSQSQAWQQQPSPQQQQPIGVGGGGDDKLDSPQQQYRRSHRGQREHQAVLKALHLLVQQTVAVDGECATAGCTFLGGFHCTQPCTLLLVTDSIWSRTKQLALFVPWWSHGNRLSPPRVAAGGGDQRFLHASLVDCPPPLKPEPPH